MALTMNWTEENTGDEHPDSYWEIDRFSTQFIHGSGTEQASTELIVKGWDSKADHDAGKNQIHIMSFEIPAGDIDPGVTVGDAIAGLYSFLLGQSFFSGATVV